MATITFKAKPIDQFVKIPAFTRRHCDMHAFRVHPKYGSYANSDLFDAILARIRKEKFGNNDWLDLNNLPNGVSVDDTGFLSVISIDV